VAMSGRRRDTHLKPDSLWEIVEHTRTGKFKNTVLFFKKYILSPIYFRQNIFEHGRGIANFLNDTEGGMLKIWNIHVFRVR